MESVRALGAREVECSLGDERPALWYLHHELSGAHLRWSPHQVHAAPVNEQVQHGYGT